MTDVSVEAVDAVLNGVVWLDELVESEIAPPTWWNQVDLDSLDMTNVQNCILGQLFSGMAMTTDHYSGYDWAHDELFDNMIEDAQYYGFTISLFGGAPYDWSDLNEAWTAAILELREKHNP